MKITNIIGYVLSSPYGDGKVFGQPKGVKSIGIVEVHTDSGLIGIGETYSAIYTPELIPEIVNLYSRLLTGSDPLDNQLINQKAVIPFIGKNGLLKSVFGAIDIACWDIKSKATKKPLWKLINEEKYNSTLKVYASGGSAIYTPNEIITDTNKAIMLGFDSYKMRVGINSWDQDLKRIEAARNTLNKNNLMIDAIMGTINPQWTTEIAIERINDIFDFNPYWLEEPLTSDNLNGYTQLTKLNKVKIACGESLTNWLDFESFITNNAINILQVDATHCGGITTAIKIINLAEKFKIPVAMHIWGSTIALLANANLALAFDTVKWFEIPLVELNLSNDIYTNPYKISENKIQFNLSESDGFDIEISKKNKLKYSFIQESGYKI